MDNRMFCFQCEQTAGCAGCTGKAGVCGKTTEVAELQDQLTGALVGLSRAVDNAPDTNEGTWRLMIEGLFTTVTNVNFNEKTIRDLIDRVHAEKARLVPNCYSCTSRCGRNDDYDMHLLWSAQEDVRSLKSLILFGVRGMAAYAYHAMVLGYTDDAVNRFFAKALFAVGEDWGMGELLPIVMEVGEKNLQCMALLDKANTETYGTPTPVTVPLTVEKGPFIVITGHDLHDLKLLLEQTAGKGVNIYTHGEMLPAHGYPELKKYPHLKGNFGTAWQNQQREFADIPAPVLFTTNCLMPPRPGYADRVFTTALVAAFFKSNHWRRGHLSAPLMSCPFAFRSLLRYSYTPPAPDNASHGRTPGDVRKAACCKSRNTLYLNIRFMARCYNNLSKLGNRQRKDRLGL